MGSFLYGTAGWSYEDWVGPFYPEGTPPGGFLRYYAGVFPAVEVDSSFYGIPSPRTVEQWAANTPDDFVFSPKMFREVTHDRFLEECDEVVDRFLAALEPLAGKLGPVILQFPYFRKASGVTLDAFLERLRPFLAARADPARFAVEIRNKTFLRPDLFATLAEHRVPLVLVDHVWMPSPREYAEIPGIFTGAVAPVRLIGDRRGIEKITDRWTKVVVDRDERLRGWAELILHAMRSGLDAQAFANNHYAGFGPDSARRLAEQVRGALPSA